MNFGQPYRKANARIFTPVCNMTNDCYAYRVCHKLGPCYDPMLMLNATILVPEVPKCSLHRRNSNSEKKRRKCGCCGVITGLKI